MTSIASLTKTAAAALAAIMVLSAGPAFAKPTVSIKAVSDEVKPPPFAFSRLYAREVVDTHALTAGQSSVRTESEDVRPPPKNYYRYNAADAPGASLGTVE